MYRRPNTYEEGVTILKANLSGTEAHKNSDMFGIFWKAGAHMMHGTWEKHMLRPLCDTSEITAFLFKTAVPIVSKMLCEVDNFESLITEGLKDESSMAHVTEMYDLLNKLLDAAKMCAKRTDVDDSLRQCATETIALFNSDYVCEAIRILCIARVETRIVLRIGLPRMTRSFLEDSGLVAEKMDWTIMTGLT